MNVTPVVDGKNINLYSKGIKQTTIHGVNSVGTPYTVGNNVIVQVKVGDNKPVTQQFDAKTGMYKTTLY